MTATPSRFGEVPVPLTVEPPSAEELLTGIVARFECRYDDQAVTVRGTAKRGDDGLTIARLEIAPDNEDVTASLTRRIPFGSLLAELRVVVPVTLDESHASTANAAPARLGGRPPLTDEHMRDVALKYIEETAPGCPPRSMKRLAEHFGRPEETIRTWVARARRDGWLGPTVKGRAGAEPGPRLLQGSARPTRERKNGVTDRFLRRVAVAYLAETAAGEPPGALRRLAQQFGKPEKTVQGWIARARKAEWLGPGHKGRMGAEPGPRLLAEKQKGRAV